MIYYLLALAELGTNYFDVVFLALPFLDEESQISFMDIAKPYWMVCNTDNNLGLFSTFVRMGVDANFVEKFHSQSNEQAIT